MGDVYWMTALLIIQSLISVVICAVLSKKTVSVIEDEGEKDK